MFLLLALKFQHLLTNPWCWHISLRNGAFLLLPPPRPPLRNMESSPFPPCFICVSQPWITSSIQLEMKPCRSHLPLWPFSCGSLLCSAKVAALEFFIVTPAFLSHASSRAVSFPDGRGVSALHRPASPCQRVAHHPALPTVMLPSESHFWLNAVSFSVLGHPPKNYVYASLMFLPVFCVWS